jgi:hypothetical protein
MSNTANEEVLPDGSILLKRLAVKKKGKSNNPSAITAA